MALSTMTTIAETTPPNVAPRVEIFEAPNQVFPFLKLPPELRNRIYHCIGEDLDGSSSEPIEYHKVASNPIESVMSYLSLANVCRQIRYEFLSTFINNQTIRVHLRHVTALLSALFPYETCHCNTLIGLNFRIETTLSKPSMSQFHMDADVRALLRLCLNAPAIQCNFTTTNATSPEASKSLEKLTKLFFDVEHRDAWKSALTNDIARVVLAESDSEHVRTVNLVMQPSFEKNWNITLPSAYGGMPEDGLWPFLEKLGFEKNSGPIRVRVSKS